MSKELQPTENHKDQASLSQKALDSKCDGAEAPKHPAPQDHPDGGLRSIPHEDQPPSGNFEAEGHRPVLERSRKAR